MSVPQRRRAEVGADRGKARGRPPGRQDNVLPRSDVVRDDLGKVTRSDTSAPVAGTLVWANLNLKGMYASTGANGSYSLPTVPFGTYSLKASATLEVASLDEEFTNRQGVNTL